MKSTRNKLAGKHLVPNSEASKSTMFYRENPSAKKKKHITSTNYNEKSVSDRDSRNEARRKKEKEIGKKLPPTIDVHHKNDNPLDNKKSNLSLVKISNNRADSKEKRKKSKPNKWYKKHKKR